MLYYFVFYSTALYRIVLHYKSSYFTRATEFAASLCQRVWTKVSLDSPMNMENISTNVGSGNDSCSSS